MGETVRLRNRSTSQVFTTSLLHALYCRRGATCRCKQEEFLAAVRDPKEGTVGFRPGMRVVPVGLAIAPGETSPALHRAVLFLPGVAEWRASGDLEVVEQPAR